MSRDGAYWLGKRVRVGAACAPSVTMTEGVVIGYLSAPSVIVRDPQGRDSTWQVTLPIDVLGEVPDDELPEQAEKQVEWGVQYEDPRRIRMDGVVSTVTMGVPSEEIARKAIGWEHSPWNEKQNKRVVRREVTEWVDG